MAKRCVRGSSDWILGQRSSLSAWSSTGTSSRGMWSWLPACQCSRSVWAKVLDTAFNFPVVWCQELDSLILLSPFHFRIFYEKLCDIFSLSDYICFCCETRILLCPLKPLAFCHLSVGLSSPANQQSAGLHNNSFPKLSLPPWNCCRMTAVIMPNADVQTSKASSRSEMRESSEHLFRYICAVICLTFHLEPIQPCLWPEHFNLRI